MATKPPKKPPIKAAKPAFDDDGFVSPAIVQKYKDKFFTVYSRDVDRFSDESLNWFRQRVIKDIRVKQSSILDAAEYGKKSGTQGNQLIGKLYFFEYEAEMAGDPEHGIYDQFPLIFIFGSSKNKQGKTVLHGLNLHYLAPKERMVLLQELLTLRSSKTVRPGMRLKLSWQMIKAVSKHKLYEKAVHSYRIDRMQSRLIEVPAVDWSVVVFLQLQKWQHIKGEGFTPSEYRTITRRRTREHMKRFKP